MKRKQLLGGLTVTCLFLVVLVIVAGAGLAVLAVELDSGGW